MKFFKKKSDIRKIFQVSVDTRKGTLDLRQREYVPRRKRPFGWLERNLQYFVVLAVTAIVSITIIVVSTPTVAQVTKFYPSSCLGDWKGTANAQGEPDANFDKFSVTKTAISNGGEKGIFCGEFSGDMLEGTQPTQATLMFEWHIGEEQEEEFFRDDNSGTEFVSDEAEGEIVDETQDTEPIEEEPGPDPGTEEENIFPISVEGAPEPLHREGTGGQEAPKEESKTESRFLGKFFSRLVSKVFAQDVGTTTTERPSAEETPPVEEATTTQPELEPATTTDKATTTIESEAVPPEENEPRPDESGRDATTTDEATTTDSVTGEENSEQAISESEEEPTPVPEEIFSEATLLEIFYTLDGTVWEPLARITEDNWENSLFPLPIASWPDLSNLQVEIRNVAQGRDALPVYLDALWVEVESQEGPFAVPIPLELEQLQTLPQEPFNIGPIGPEVYFGINDFIDFNLKIPQLTPEILQRFSISVATSAPPGLDGLAPLDTVPQANGVLSPEERRRVEEFGTTTKDILILEPVEKDPIRDDGSETEPASNGTGETQEQSTTTEEIPHESSDHSHTDEIIDSHEHSDGSVHNNSNGTETSPSEKPSGQATTTTGIRRFLGSTVHKAHAQTFTFAGTPRVVATRLIDPRGNDSAVPFSTSITDGTIQVTVSRPGRNFKGGRYKLEFDIEQDGIFFKAEQTFLWGVLAVNMNRATYRTGEEAYIQMGALNDRGGTLCDAELSLTVTAPDSTTEVFTTEDGTLVSSDTCGPDNVTDKPDYFVRYQVGDEGLYTLKLENLSNGYSVNDEFAVSNEQPFYIERVGATRINPFRGVYAMELRVEATEAFRGNVTEQLPPDFTVVGKGGGSIKDGKDVKTLTWQVDLEPGAERSLRYVYQAPEISPELFFLGPARISEGGFSLLNLFTFKGQSGREYQEGRQWQLASDAAGKMILFFAGTGAIPSGWSEVSKNQLGFNDFYQKFIRGSSTYSAGGFGSATHNHTGSGSVSATGAFDGKTKGASGGIADGPHVHANSPPSVTFTAASNLPSYRQLRVIKADTDGELSIPVDAVAVFDTTVPSGYSQYSAQNGRFIRGEATVGTTGGSNTHQHTVSGTTGTSPDTKDANGSGTNVATNNHTHSYSGLTDPARDLQPPYISVILGIKTGSAATPPNGLIAMWDDTPATGWDSVSGPGGAFNGKFLKASTTYDTSAQGASSHNHVNFSITSGTASAQTAAGSASQATPPSHTHSINISSVSTNNHLPPYVDVIFAKRDVDPVPRITNLQFYNSFYGINLIENTFKWASSTMLITDEDSSCQGITSVTAKAYLASTTNSGTTCTYNGNNCNPSVVCMATSTNACTGPSDPDVAYECGFQFWYIAQPTDATGWDSSIWSVAATSSDGTNNGTATNTTQRMSVNTLVALDVTSSINYGSVDEGTNTGSTNQVSTTTNTGNISIDADIGGDDMVKGADTISYAEQKFSTSPFTYSGGGTVLTASTSPTLVVLDLPKPTATTTPVEDPIYWGINIPGSQPTGAYTGTNYFFACLDNGVCESRDYDVVYRGNGGSDVSYDRIGAGEFSQVIIDDPSNLRTTRGKRHLVRTKNKDLFFGVNKSSQCRIYKSTDDGAIWQEQDSGDRPGCLTGGDFRGFGGIATDGNDIIHMVYRDETTASSTKYITFNTGTSQYGTEENVYTATTTTNVSPFVAIDSNNIPHVVISSLNGIAQVLYTNRIGGSWKAPVVLETGSPIHQGSLVINEDNIPEVVYRGNGTDEMTVAEGNQNDATSFTLQDLETGNVYSGMNPMLVVDSSGNTYVMYRSIVGDLLKLRKHNDSDSWSTWQASTTNNAIAITGSVLADGTDIYVVYEGFNQEYYDRYDGTSWLGQQVLESENNEPDPSVRWSFWHNN